MILPPGVLKALQAAIAKHEDHLAKAAVVRAQIRDAVADIGVCLTPLGMEVLTAIAAYMAQTQEEVMEPEDAVRAADAFMVRWASERDREAKVAAGAEVYILDAPDLRIKK